MTPPPPIDDKRETIAFRMQLNPGKADEYRRRHAGIWPDLVAELKAAGISDYWIFLDEATGHLIGVLKRDPDHTMDELPGKAVMRRWWDYMADIMAVEADNAPVVVSLKAVFNMK